MNDHYTYSQRKQAYLSRRTSSTMPTPITRGGHSKAIPAIIKPPLPSRSVPRPPPRQTGVAHTDREDIHAVLKVRNYLPWYIGAPPGTPTVMPGVALILCHYGQDPRRIVASKQALQWTLQSRPSPLIVFVEAADAGQPRHFEHLSQYGVTYIPRDIPEQGVGIWLKEALWSIGAEAAVADATITNLCFLDVDCHFVRQDWASQISDALENYDVISPHAYGYFSNQPDASLPGRSHIRESVGSRVTKGQSQGFPGFAVAMTRAFFHDRLHDRMPLASDGEGDTLFWRTILGITRYGTSSVHGSITQNMRRGMVPTPRIGTAGLILCHHYHGPFSERGYYARTMLTHAAVETPFTEFTYLPDGMPVWNMGTPGGRILAKVFPEYREGALSLKDKADSAYARQLYDAAAEVEYGAIDDANPLVITCLLRMGGIYTPKHVKSLKRQFDKHCKTPFTFVCLSDVNIPGVTTIPLSFTRDDCPGWWGQVEYFRKDLFPATASILACDLDNVVLKDFTMHQCPAGSLFTGREIGDWLKSTWGVWNFGVTYWRGDFSCVYDKYATDIHHYYKHPHYQHISVQEFIYDTLRSHEVYPRCVDAHIMTRFYNGPDKRHPTGTVILQFPAHPKPWELKPKPDWLPDLQA